MLLAILLGITAPCYGQVQDTLGVTDTLYFGVVSGGPGDQVVLAVSVTNDVPYLGMSIPVVYPSPALTADSVTFAHGRVAHFAQLTANIDNDRGALLIGAVQFTGDPMAAGSGPVAWIHFTVSPGELPGDTVPVDTGYFSDPGVLLFSADVDGGTSILPFVVAGGVKIIPPNTPPDFAPTASTTVREGDSLAIHVTASDAQGDPIRLALLNRPVGAQFTDLGGGEGDFKWQVPFTGPYSAESSPLVLKFAADDGRDVSVHDVPVEIINVNHAPVLSVPDTLMVPAFDTLNWQIDASDPDAEPITITFVGLPVGAEMIEGTPLGVRWQPVLADTGYHPVTVHAEDEHGAYSEQTATLYVTAVPRVEFTIGQVSGYNDQEVVLPIRMKNTEIIGGFELLFNVDPTAVSIVSVNTDSARTADWEMFAVTLNYNGNPGDVRVVARADVADGTVTPKLDPGEGVIVNVRLHLINDIAYAGLSFPVRFVFRSALANTAVDAANMVIYQDQIAYTHGSVDIVLYDNILPGDINLNGLAFEIGDVVYFANFFTNPIKYPMSFEQRANSDANQDGIPATIADLVFMLSKLTGGVLLRGTPSAGQTASWSLSPSGSLAIQSQGPLGGVFIRYRSAAPELPSSGPAAAAMTLLAHRNGDEVRAVLYSTTGAVIDPQAGDLLEGLRAAEIVELQMADPGGRTVDVAPRAVRPEVPELLGNYPNPFNPSTSIRFALPQQGEVRIEIYNALGQQVRRLAGAFAAGEHELTWDGRDEAGASVSSGVYFYRLESGATRQVRRMLLLK